MIFDQPRLRLDGAIRTSKRKKDAKSPKQQRDVIHSSASAHGHDVLVIHDSGRDESGKTMDRATLNLVMERARAGLTDGLIVALADRLGRAPIEEAMAYVRTLTGVGVLVLADMGGVPLNLNDPAQESNLVFQLQMARQYWLTTANRALQSRIDAVREGRYVGSAVPGFDKIGKGEPDAGKLIRNGDAEFMERVFSAAATSMRAAQDMLRERWPNGRWDADRVRKLLRSPAYKGWSVSGDLINRHAHDRIVSESEWEAAQHAPRERRSNGGYPLSGVVTCACGAAMVGALQTVNGRSYRRMRCSGCQRASIGADALERHVRDWLRPLVGGGYFELTFGDAELVDAERAAQRARAERDEFAADLAFQRDLGPEGRRANARALAAAVEQAETRLRDAAGRSAQATRTVTSIAELETPNGLRTAARLAVTGGPIAVAPGRAPIDRRVALPKLDRRAGKAAA